MRRTVLLRPILLGSALLGALGCGSDGTEPAPSRPRPAPSLAACIADRACDYPLAVAHRGEGAGEPENSLTAISGAAALGADVVEIDIRQSLDGVFVLMHDGTVSRTTEPAALATTEVSELTYAELQTLTLDDGAGRCADPAQPDFAARCRVPTLIQALEAARGRTLLMLDFKSGDAAAVAQLLAEHDGLDVAFLFEEDPTRLAAARAAAPGIVTMPRVRNSTAALILIEAADAPLILHADPNYLDKIGAEAQARRVKLFVDVFADVDLYLMSESFGGTVDWEEARRRFAALVSDGADVMQTNFLGGLRRLIDEHVAASP